MKLLVTMFDKWVSPMSYSFDPEQSVTPVQIYIYHPGDKLHVVWIQQPDDTMTVCVVYQR